MSRDYDVIKVTEVNVNGNNNLIQQYIRYLKGS